MEIFTNEPVDDGIKVTFISPLVALYSNSLYYSLYRAGTHERHIFLYTILRVDVEGFISSKGNNVKEEAESLHLWVQDDSERHGGMKWRGLNHVPSIYLPRP